MVRIGKMGVNVNHRFMPMKVNVFYPRLDRKFMSMLMVLIMNMLMTVLHRFVGMFMLMPFGQMQPDAYGHQGASEQ